MSRSIRSDPGLFACLVAAAAMPLAGAPHGSPQRYEAVEPHMGTLVRVTVYTPSEEDAARAFRAAFARIRELDGILSDYKPDSELNRLARSAAGRPVRVSGDLLTVLDAGQRLARETGGAFDVTQGPVVRLWRQARRTGEAPAPDALREAAARSGYRKLTLDGEARTATLAGEGMALDVGALGKGYAASEALQVLTSLGVRSALVAVSGDLAFSAAPPGRGGWRIDVHAVPREDTDVPAVLELTHAAVSTSGAGTQHVDIGGRRYSHVIDPASGMGLAGDLTVTVVARDGLTADGLDTAISVLGLDEGMRLVEARPGAAALVVRRGGGGTTVTASARFQALPAAPPR